MYERKDDGSYDIVSFSDKSLKGEKVAYGIVPNVHWYIQGKRIYRELRSAYTSDIKKNLPLRHVFFWENGRFVTQYLKNGKM
ncbi:hypothetical protein [Eisenibacter elegans]|uniref:hypothetical protein n=1 Tax=Eisenibacter elegans TaxID=997 RepID=UPI00040255D9|nr:hypothetical protein [Eisenibacter elegans]